MAYVPLAMDEGVGTSASVFAAVQLFGRFDLNVAINPDKLSLVI